MSTTNGAPIDYPTINIYGTTYQIKFGLGAMIRLEKAGVNVFAAREELASGKGLPITRMMQLLGAALGRTTDDGPHAGRWVPLKMDIEELADALGQDPAALTSLTAKLQDAMVKAPPAEAPQPQPEAASGIQ